MNWLIVSCPTCNFLLMVTDRKLLGRPARCPQCRTKFILEESGDQDYSSDFANSVTAMVVEHPSDEVTDTQSLRVEDGRTYITEYQLKKCHTADEVDRFVRWIDQAGKPTAASGQGFFLSDYVEWCEVENTG